MNILREEYEMLPQSLKQQLPYNFIKNYVFWGVKMPNLLKKIIGKKRTGYKHAEAITTLRGIAQSYGCVNEEDLEERCLFLLKTSYLFRSESTYNLKWQKKSLN